VTNVFYFKILTGIKPVFFLNGMVLAKVVSLRGFSGYIMI